MRHYSDIIIAPVITEKSMAERQNGVYTFKVAKDADKPEIKKAIEEVTEALGDEGRILVRESGTEPLIRVMVEAQTDEICHENVLKVVNLIKEKGYAVK